VLLQLMVVLIKFKIQLFLLLSQREVPKIGLVSSRLSARQSAHNKSRTPEWIFKKFGVQEFTIFL